MNFIERFYEWFFNRLEKQEKERQQELQKPFFQRKKTRFALITAPIISLVVTLLIALVAYIYVNFF